MSTRHTSTRARWSVGGRRHARRKEEEQQQRAVGVLLGGEARADDGEKGEERQEDTARDDGRWVVPVADVEEVEHDENERRRERQRVEVAPVGDEGVEDHRSEADEGEAHHEEGIRHRTRDHEQDDVEWRQRNAPTLECVPGVRLRMRARGAARHDG